MVIAAPRSGTTWAANWLTTEHSLCLHDPLANYHYSQLDSITSDRMIGISCTAIANYRRYLGTHKAKKLILHRKHEEVQESLEKQGLPPLYHNWEDALNDIDGLHLHWKDLFFEVTAVHAYKYLTGLDMDIPRYRELIKLNVQPNFGSLSFNIEAAKKYVNDVIRAVSQ